MDRVQLPQGYTEPLRGGRLLFTTMFPEIPGTHLILRLQCIFEKLTKSRK